MTPYSKLNFYVSSRSCLLFLHLVSSKTIFHMLASNTWFLAHYLTVFSSCSLFFHYTTVLGTINQCFFTTLFLKITLKYLHLFKLSFFHIKKQFICDLFLPLLFSHLMLFYFPIKSFHICPLIRLCNSSNLLPSHSSLKNHNLYALS